MHTAIRSACRSAVAGAFLVVALAGCSAGRPAADKCATVSAPMSDIPTRTDQEPKMRIPVPQGWSRSTKNDNESVRYAISNPAMATDKFTPNAVVTLQKTPVSIGKPDQILQAQNDQLTQKLKVTEMQSKSTDVCGAKATESTYTAPELKLGPNFPTIPPRKATTLSTVYKEGDSYYVATVTVQAVKADDPTYAKDVETIIKGFQMFPPK